MGCLRPDKPAGFEPFGEQTQSVTVPPQQLHPIATATTKDEDLARERIGLKLCLDQCGQAIEAAYGLGARKASTCIKVVLPASISGIVAALILATSRAIGETMVVVLAAGGSGGAAFSLDPTQQGLTMTAAMATVARGTDQVAGSGPTFQSLFFVGLLLFAFTFGLNVIANRVVRRIREKY